VTGLSEEIARLENSLVEYLAKVCVESTAVNIGRRIHPTSAIEDSKFLFEPISRSSLTL
jgi:hypothetical protein